MAHTNRWPYHNMAYAPISFCCGFWMASLLQLFLGNRFYGIVASGMPLTRDFSLVILK
jgi:hypothetical protein